MTKFLLPLMLAAASAAFGQYGEQLYASIERPANYIGCSAYSDLSTPAAKVNRTATTENKTLATARLRLLNQSHAVQALINSTARSVSTDFRIMRTVDPTLGWEIIAEVDHIDSDGPIAINDEDPLPGRALYKLETRTTGGEWEMLDIRVVNRPLGMYLGDIDFLTAPFGALTLPQTMLPQSDYTVEVFDLQGGRMEVSHVRFGHKLKVHTAHLPFGVYEVVITGQSSRVAKFFLASGQ